MIVLTPHYKPTLSFIEETRLKKSLLNITAQHAFILPKNLNATFLSSFPNSSVFRFNDNFFQSRSDYSRLLLSEEFYSKFAQYKFMTILQTDAILVKSIPIHLYSEFDYIGAPWKETKKILLTRKLLSINSRRKPWRRRIKVDVGNGGLSIRRIESMNKCIEIVQNKFPFLANGRYNEDTVLATILKLYNFSVPNAKQASEIFCEHFALGQNSAADCYGYHALERYNPKLEKEILGLA